MTSFEDSYGEKCFINSLVAPEVNTEEVHGGGDIQSTHYQHPCCDSDWLAVASVLLFLKQETFPVPSVPTKQTHTWPCWPLPDP